MDANNANTESARHDRSWRVQALAGLGYLTGCFEQQPNTTPEFDIAYQQAIERFRRACRWNPFGDDGPSVSTELFRQVAALQDKLFTLGCYTAGQGFDSGRFDSATRAAVICAETRFGEQCRKALQLSVAAHPVLSRYMNLDEAQSAQWLQQIGPQEHDALCQALNQFGMLDIAGLSTSEISPSARDSAARSCRTYLLAGLSKSEPGVCTAALRDFIAGQPPFTFDEVLHQELAAIQRARQAVNQHFGVTSSPQAHSLSRAHEARLMGLAFSGGGIRSATFNLGVLQALASARLLHRFDYLSSVSGGGYIAAWLHAWVHREASDRTPAGILKVEEQLAQIAHSGSEHTGCARPAKASNPHVDETNSHEPDTVAWLRRYSNYLTPKLGPLGDDTMAAVSTWLRNALLNLLLLLLVVTPVLFVPWTLTQLLDSLQSLGESGSTPAFYLSCLLLMFAAGLAALITAENNPWHGSRQATEGVAQPTLRHKLFSLVTSRKLQETMGLIQSSQVGVARLVILALCLASLGIGYAIITWPQWAGDWFLFLPTFLAYALPAQLFLLIDDQSHGTLHSGAKIKRRVARIGSGFIGGLLFALLMLALIANLPENLTAAGRFLSIILIPPAVMGALLLAAALHIGVAGRSLRESAREWWSRIGGILLRTALIWLVLTAVALYAAYALSYVHGVITALGGLAWVATTLAGLIAGRSGGGGGRWRKMLVGLTPYVFMAGLALLLSWGLHGAMLKGAGKLIDDQTPQSALLKQNYCPKPSPQTTLTLSLTDGTEKAAARIAAAENEEQAKCDHDLYAQQADVALNLLANSLSVYFNQPAHATPLPQWIFHPQVVLLGVSMLSLILAALLGLTVDINVFAFHMFYRNRLERCYLGASNKERKADRYTDLDPRDSPRLDALTLPGSSFAQRPYPLINTALNLTRSDNLAWQERKAASFIFTPQYCGYQLTSGQPANKGAYQQARDFVRDIGGWLSLATPVTISGAAASPNAGYHTSAALAVLMTIFNVRLGMWIQNPRLSGVWRKPGPRQSLKYLLKELTSSTNENSDFVYLSDGGHFENLGLYELVRRRCRYIVVCDAGCDPDFTFEDLGNAIRKCKVDLGIEIDIDTRAIKPDPDSGRSRSHCAVGTIHYERVDSTRAVAQGYLLYVKASLTGNEPADVGQYAAQHAAFPHESTGDQWYTESQFESYRALGLHIMSSLLEDAISDEHRERHRRGAGLDKLMHRLLNTGMDTQGAGSVPGDFPPTEPLDRELLFKRLAERWYRPGNPSPHASGHAMALQTLLTRQEQNPRLRFLDQQIFPEWSHMTVTEQQPTPENGGALFPPSHRELRAGFYFCLELIQLMDRVYLECDLEHEHQHPDNRGWMNLFRHWSGSGMFRATWAINACNFSARFLQFCGRRINLDIGRVQLGQRLALTEAMTNSLFTPVEHQQLARLSQEYPHWKGNGVLVAPLEIQVGENGEGAAAPFRFPFGFALIEGYFSTERSQDHKASQRASERYLRYFRIRDHLRRMGLGRRGLECLWREDVKFRVDPPSNINCVIDEADPQGLLRLWHSVLAAVPNREIRHAHELLDTVESPIDKAIQQSGTKDPLAIQHLRKQILQEKNDTLDKAEKELLQALAEQPDNDEAWRSIARIYAYRSRYKIACSILDQMIRRDPNCSLAYYNRAALKLRRLNLRLASRLRKETINRIRKDAIENDLRKAIELDRSLAMTASKDEDFDAVRKLQMFRKLLTGN